MQFEVEEKKQISVRRRNRLRKSASLWSSLLLAEETQNAKEKQKKKLH